MLVVPAAQASSAILFCEIDTASVQHLTPADGFDVEKLRIAYNVIVHCPSAALLDERELS